LKVERHLFIGLAIDDLSSRENIGGNESHSLLRLLLQILLFPTKAAMEKVPLYRIDLLEVAMET
jgi:hypothetical protein